MGRTAVFRADASATIGNGHVSRCLALADGLAGRGWSCTFAVSPDTLWAIPALSGSGHTVFTLQAGGDHIAVLRAAVPGGADLLVVDHYRLDAEFESQARGWARRILSIDDLADRPHDADMLLDQTFGRREGDYRELLPRRCRQLLGPDYALLRPAFGAARDGALARRREGQVRRIMISMGGSDPNDITSVALGAALSVGLEVDVVVGAASPNLPVVRAAAEAAGAQVTLHVDTRAMADLMSRCDLAIGAGGVTSWERCVLGLPTIIIVTANNQALVAKRLAAAGAARVYPVRKEVDSGRLGAMIDELANSPDLVREMGYRAAAICDGQGVDRVAEILDRNE